MSKTLARERAERIVEGDAEWRAQLTSEQYRIMRQHGTERAGTFPLDEEKCAAVFTCASCGPREATGLRINGAALTFKPGDP
jgi:hypothetical protein